jgi:hypothetical protein
MTDSDEPDALEYRVIVGREQRFDLFEIGSGTPLIVTADPERYEDASVRETIRSLEPGNKIQATLEATEDAVDTGLFESQVYRFTHVAVSDRTRTYHGFGDIPIVDHAEAIVTKLGKTGNGIGRATIKENGNEIGRIVVFNRDHPSPAEPVFESELESMHELGAPPFYVFQSATEDGRFFVHYYLVSEDSELYDGFTQHVAQGDDSWEETAPPSALQSE